MACKQPSNGDQTECLELRIEHLERVNSWHSHSLDILNSMGYMHGNAAENRKPQHIFRFTREHLNRVVNFHTSAFLDVREEDADFRLCNCQPLEHRDYIQRQIDHLINNGNFAWAINQNRTIELKSADGQHILLLHVLASRSRVRGMFIGLLPVGKDAPMPAAQQLISIILTNTAYALESAILYKMVHEQNQFLEEALQQQAHELEHQHSHDTLTTLPNRMLFIDRVYQAMTRAKHHNRFIAVMLVDIDNFKRINEAIGTTSADRLLTRIGKRLIAFQDEMSQEQHIDEGQTLTAYRFGGDEFAILVSDLHKTEPVYRIAQQLQQRLTSRIDIHGNDVEVTTSIGIALYPGDAVDAQWLIKNAERAMHHARQQGRNYTQYYSEALNTTSTEQLVMENQLRMALGKDEFFLQYQPKISCQTGEISGFEALIRWDNREQGVIPPVQFIPLAEESGLITEIGKWVLTIACRQASAWLTAGHHGISVAVNLSARQFRQKELLQQVITILNESGLPPHHLELEITESTLMEDIDTATATLNSLHRLGIKLSIDDFGTGYSSLYYLKRFPIDKLKIDRQFVKDITTNSNDAIMVRAILAMAHNMGLRVVAEGVETKEQLHMLQTLGCDEIQGYLTSRPVHAVVAGQQLQSDNLIAGFQ